MNDHNYAKVLKLSQISSVTRHMFSMSDHNYSKVDLDVDLLNEMHSQLELITVKALRNGVRRGVTYSHVVKQNQPSRKSKLSTTASTKTSKSKAVYTTTNPGKNAHNDKENSFQSTAISHCSQHIEMKSDTSLDSFNIQNVPGDGNCFFHCLSLNMFGDCKNSSNIRTNTCGFVLQNWYSMENKVNLQHSITNRAHYARQMIYKNGYATACEIEAASVYYKRQINIWLRNGPNNQIMLTQFSPNNETSNKPIDLLLEREHFQLLRPTTDSPVLNLKRPTSLQSVEKIKKAKKVTIRPNDVINFSKRPPTNMTESTKPENCCTQQSKISIESDTFIIPNVKSRKPKQKKGKKGQNSLKNKLVTKDKVFVDNKCDNVCSQSRPRFFESRDNKGNNANEQTKNSPLEKSNANKHTTNISNNDLQSPVPDKTVTENREEALKYQSRKLGLTNKGPTENENNTDRIKRHRSIKHKIRRKTNLISNSNEIPSPPPPSNDPQFDKAMDSIRNFELQEMNYNIDLCKICNVRRIDMKMSSNDLCKRCATDKSQIKQFSTENNMNPGILPKELSNLSILEQQLICRISPCINIHLLKHGGIGSSGHCVTFP